MTRASTAPPTARGDSGDDLGEIRQLDAGVRFGERWRGLRIPRFEEVLDVVDGRAGLNLHVKDPGPQGALVRMMRAELRKRGLVELAYLGGNEKTLRAAREIAPEIPRACLDRQSEPDRQIDLAVEYGCRRIQFYRHATEENTSSPVIWASSATSTGQTSRPTRAPTWSAASM